MQPYDRRAAAQANALGQSDSVPHNQTLSNASRTGNTYAGNRVTLLPSGVPNEPATGQRADRIFYYNVTTQARNPDSFINIPLTITGVDNRNFSIGTISHNNQSCRWTVNTILGLHDNDTVQIEKQPKLNGYVYLMKKIDQVANTPGQINFVRV